MVIDLGWPLSFVEGAIEAFGDYIDIVKLVELHLTQPTEVVRRKIALYRAAGIDVEPGGVIVEIARAQGCEGPALETMRTLGFDSIEVSASTSSREVDDDLRFIEEAKRLGFKIYGEVGKKFVEGDSTRLGEDRIDIDATVAEMKALVAAGCRGVFWEGQVLKHLLGTTPGAIIERDAQARPQLEAVASQVGVENIIFEVSSLIPFESRRALQAWLIHLFGPDVNIGNARLEEIPMLEHTRLGTWPIFGIGSIGDHPWIQAISHNSPGGHDGWWRGA
jgi:phosphosulfolactate synthase